MVSRHFCMLKRRRNLLQVLYPLLTRFMLAVQARAPTEESDSPSVKSGRHNRRDACHLHAVNSHGLERGRPLWYTVNRLLTHALRKSEISRCYCALFPQLLCVAVLSHVMALSLMRTGNQLSEVSRVVRFRWLCWPKSWSAQTCE
jgi:hypothetical protein